MVRQQYIEMEGRPNRGRGGSWKKGGRGGNEGDSFGGERRGRGRGSHYRGRGKRDHYRGRGRGGGAYAAELHHRDDDEEEKVHEEDDGAREFSRRKLESNWDRYKETEKEESADDMPTQRGIDFDVLLSAAGDSFSQFRFSEEKEWDTDSFVLNQISALFVDLPALAQTLQQLPLHQRLNLEPELELTTPADLPAMTFTPKQEMAKVPAFTAPSASFKSLSNKHCSPMAETQALVPDSQVSSSTAGPPLVENDDDEELDQLLSLQQPVSAVPGNQPVSAADESVPEKACEDVKEVIEEKTEEVTDKPPKSASVRKEVTEEDLEDWLDSMIS